MTFFYFFWASFFSFWTILSATGPENSDCLEREKALVSLETVEDYLSKVKDSYPSCNEDSNSTDQSECGGKRSLAYIEVAKILISDVRENFPKCPKDIVEHVKGRDCSEILASGQIKSGIYTIWPSVSNTTGKPLQVYCDMKTDDGGWTVIQRRGKFPVQRDFDQDWETYKNGFGNIKEEFWLGNENIRVLCHNGCEIRFDLIDKDGIDGFAVYKNFNLSGSNYTLHISDYEGDVGDAMTYNSDYAFSTKDKGNMEIAQNMRGGWWYSGISYCNLNSLYPSENQALHFFWVGWRLDDVLSSSEIKVRPT